MILIRALWRCGGGESPLEWARERIRDEEAQTTKSAKAFKKIFSERK